MGSIDDAIAAGDAPALVRATVRAMRAEAEGQFCRCQNPDLTGRKSYLCFACELPNIERKREIEAAMASPHPFEPIERAHRLLIDLCCDFCAHPRKHRVHQEREGAGRDAE